MKQGHTVLWFNDDTEEVAKLLSVFPEAEKLGELSSSGVQRRRQHD